MSSIGLPQPSTPFPHCAQVRMRVVAGDRELIPTHVAYDRLIFSTPPRLGATQVRIIIEVDQTRREWHATVLPHSPQAIRIPIVLH